MLLRSAVIGFTIFSSGLTPAPHTDRSNKAAVGFAFRSPAFDKFVSDSYRVNGGDPRDFYRWFDETFRKVAGSSANDFLSGNRTHIESLTGNDRVVAELQLASSIHGIVRKMLPVFSLERGYEFAEAERHGKRQCLLQSTLTSSLLQRAGLQSGIVMIYRKPDGELSNNGHNVAMLRLSDGTDVLVDCSSRSPFAEHRGLFVRKPKGGYLYVDPIYHADKPGVIKGYVEVASHHQISGSRIDILDNAFLNSQFDYYRAERADHGVMDMTSNAMGLATSITFLEASVRECPNNPLAVYVLGRAYKMRGDRDLAKTQFERARRLYSEYGWIPQSVRTAR